jgi:hypothetical protein
MIQLQMTSFVQRKGARKSEVLEARYWLLRIERSLPTLP